MSSSSLRKLLGARQAEVMHTLWQHGAATVRELHALLAVDGVPTYATVLIICTRLRDKGFVERRRVLAEEYGTRAKQAYVYAPCVTEATLLRQTRSTPPPLLHQVQSGTERAAIERLLAYLGMLQDTAGRPVAEQALDTIVALLERAESAERAILIYQAEAVRARHRAEAVEQRAEAAPAPKPRRAKSTPAAAVYDYPGPVCRVCGRPAPPSPSKRLGDFRVCSLVSCRQEARRRDNAAKQRRSNARKRAQQTTTDTASAEGISM